MSSKSLNVVLYLLYFLLGKEGYEALLSPLAVKGSVALLSHILLLHITIWVNFT